MKPVSSAMLIIAALIMYGCGAVGVLEEENVELRDTVDSLSSLQDDLKDRVQYLEKQNIELDNTNRQLQSRLTGSGGITPPNYLVTGEKPKLAAPLTATTMNQSPKYTITSQPQTAQPQPLVQRQSTAPSVSDNRAAQEEATYRTDEEMQPRSEVQQQANQSQQANQAQQAQPWKAERYAVESGATGAQPQKWSYGAQPSTANTSRYNYGASPSKTPPGKYGQQFDQKQGAARTEYAQPSGKQGGWEGYSNRNGATSSSAAQPTQAAPRTSQPRDIPESGTVQPQIQTQPPPQVVQTMPEPARTKPAQRMPAPVVKQQEPAAGAQALPSSVSATFADMKRDANYSFLAEYQKGLAAFKKADYSGCIALLTSLLQQSAVNSMSDNCDFWIAESYYAIRDFSSAKHYYNRVVSYPESDKSQDARQRISMLN